MATANGDTLTGFTAGTGSTRDIVLLSDANTTNSIAGVQMAASSPTATSATPVTLDVANFDVFEFAFDPAAGDVTLTNSSSLIDALNTSSSGGNDNATVNVAANGKGYIVAYDSGNAYLFYFADSGNGVLASGEIELIGTFNSVAVGGFDASNFVLV
jgi:hypothetical protein